MTPRSATPSGGHRLDAAPRPRFPPFRVDPFGYRADALSHPHVVEPTEAAVVKDIFEQTANGGRPSGIALVMNTNIRKTTVGRIAARQGWTAKSVLRLLGNRTYLGEVAGVPDRHEAVVNAELFERARATVVARRTREPGHRATPPFDLFMLRRLIRCARCGRKMTTSTARALPDQNGRSSVTDRKPRYYRCRGAQECRGSQVSAQDMERRVIDWFRDPTGSVTEHAREVLSFLARRWSRLPREHRQGVLAQLVWEVRWNGPKNVFTVLLDDTAVEETHLGLEIEREEAKAKPTPRSGKGPRRRPEPSARVGEPGK